MSDDLSGDMLAPSWPNLVKLELKEVTFLNMFFTCFCESCSTVSPNINFMKCVCPFKMYKFVTFQSYFSFIYSNETIMATSSSQPLTELGFVEKVEGWRLFSHYFPSKVGGKPAWLSLKCLPSSDDLKCKLCQETPIFLMQVYANLDERDDCFHRSIFVFICKNPKCLQMDSSQSVFAYRSQLPKINTFYPSEPPSEESLADVYPKAEDFQKLCVVCGNIGSKTCSKCHRVSYCSKEHQAADWKTRHKKYCGQSEDS